MAQQKTLERKRQLQLAARRRRRRRRQSASLSSSSSPSSSSPSPHDLTADHALLRELVRLVRLCDAVYASSPEQFAREAMLPRESVVQWQSAGVLSPAFAVVCDHAVREIAVVVRGSASLLDFCTDLCLTNEPFRGGQGHRGMVHAAHALVAMVQPALETHVAEHPDYAVRITGHSLGASVSALATMELREQFPTLTCVAFGTPASVTEPLARSCRGFVTSIVNGDDCVPRLHQHSLLRLQEQVTVFDWREALQTMLADEVALQTNRVRKKRDAHVEHVSEALQRLAQQQQDRVASLLASSPLGQRVSASIEITRAAFRTDEQPALARLSAVKHELRRQRAVRARVQGADNAEDNAWWHGVETSVEALELLVTALRRPDELMTLQKQSNRLSNALRRWQAEKRSDKVKGKDTAKDMEEGETQTLPPQLARYRDRLLQVVDRATESLTDEVKSQIDNVTDVSETVTSNVQEYVQELREDAEAAIQARADEIEDELRELQDDVRARAQSLVRGIRQDEGDARAHQDVMTFENEEDTQQAARDSLAKAGDDASASDTVLLHDPLFPPGRILYLNPHREVHHPLEIDGTEEDNEDARDAQDAHDDDSHEDDQDDHIELVDVDNDEFSRVLLSNQMILDHLCTAYERVLREAAAQQGI